MPKLSYYKDEDTLKQLTARLLPPSAAYPDSICELLLTDRNFYVLEDNYDGSYTEHFIIPLSRVDAMEKVIENKEGAAAGARGVFFDVLTGFIAAAAMLAGNADAHTPNTEYLKVTYRDIADRKEVLFFKDCTPSISSFVKAFRRYKF